MVTKFTNLGFWTTMTIWYKYKPTTGIHTIVFSKFSLWLFQEFVLFYSYCFFVFFFFGRGWKEWWPILFLFHVFVIQLLAIGISIVIFPHEIILPGFFSLVFYMPKKNKEEEEETFGKLILNLHIVIVSWSGFFLVTNDNKQYVYEMPTKNRQWR